MVLVLLDFGEKLRALIIALKHGQAVNTPDDRSWGTGFKYCWRQNSAHDCKALHCTESFIITFPSSQYDLNNVERNVNLSLAEHDMPCLSKQCRSRSVGF